MAERLEIYKCEVCGSIVEVLHGGDGELVCCGQPMNRFVENTVDAAKEKHVPVIEKVEGGVKVKVGSVAHPMDRPLLLRYYLHILPSLQHLFYHQFRRNKFLDLGFHVMLQCHLRCAAC